MYKEQALEEFKNEHYDEAIALLQKGLQLDSTDSETYYYLGFFNHYRAYDSRPLSGYDLNYSTQIFNYLDQAITLNPNYGDAKYFYGAECSANAFWAMQNYDLGKLKYYYSLANQKGAYPEWLKEFGRNMLKSCASNGILFTGGNADFDICTYLQLHENFRTDITIIPIGNIDRPWYVSFLKKGLLNGVRPINLNLTESQILDIHPFKWDTTTLFIPITKPLIDEFQLKETVQMEFMIVPDLFSERLHAKIESENQKKRSYLSPQRAILIQIIEDNFAERPIYFSNFCSPSLYAGLDDYFQNKGLVSRLTPIKTKNSKFENDLQAMEDLMQADNIKHFKSIPIENIPRVSPIIINGYYNMFFTMITQPNINPENQVRWRNLFNNYLKINIDILFENEILEQLNKK